MLLLVLASCFNASAQTGGKKTDMVVKANGDVLNGKVTEINDDAIKFIHAGETLVYTIKKSDILKITYASGRVESFSAPAAAPAATPAATSAPGNAPAPMLVTDPSERRNKVAILPFGFIKDGQPQAQEVSDEIQNEAYALLSKHSGVYNILSPRGTNVKLAQAGITRDKMLNYTMADLCQILGVEFVVDGLVTQNRTSQTSTGTTTYNNKGNDDDKKRSGVATSTATSQQNYQTRLDLKIYNDKSDIIYNQNRQAFWNTEDAYKNVLEYLVKRSPLYTK
ncbi:hypothetical protein SAMN05444266_104535 [Chitinophaga jiangningensis]|uniref:Uncharacterized protein n=2 Tax=Chitinophaga jiangningensis TaxID=1419482 RepID=A0A1M7CZ55_9BACT|nr:hypothetical protein SAMN05444266_104535 [Chitinophaga jiangningensis]